MSVPQQSDQQSEGYRILQRRLGFKHPSRVTEEAAKAHPQWSALTALQQQQVTHYILRQLVPA